jgi:3-oxo-5-alpha-steroid 4-dehydrogenase 1
VSELGAYRAVLWGWLALSAITFITLFFRTAPYGRHTQRGWGPTIAPRWGWLLMEAPAALVIAGFALPAIARADWPQGWLLIGLWELHYLNRAFVFPFRLRSTRPMPMAVVAMAIVFNFMNGWLNARGLTAFGPELGRAAITSPRVLTGTALFLVGLAINWDADARLLRMPRSADGGYTIPRGGLHDLVSCPNYLGEIIEWLGFALAAGSLAALGFAVWTFANLAPRAVAHHAWYRAQFPDYPPSRRALIPYLW